MNSKFYPDQPMSAHEKKFWEYHEANPQVAEHLFSILLRARARGFSQYGINAASEIYRWEVQDNPTRIDQYKISNTHRPFYARLFQQTYPGAASFVRTKEQFSLAA